MNMYYHSDNIYNSILVHSISIVLVLVILVRLSVSGIPKPRLIIFYSSHTHFHCDSLNFAVTV